MLRGSIGAMDGFGMVPLDGGWSGETFLADAAGERSVVRIYAARGATRGPAAAEVDAAVLRLVRGLLPVPEVLEVRRPDPASGAPALLVTSFLPGERLDLVLPRLDDAARGRLGERLGRLLGRLAQMPMLRPGCFLDGELRLGELPAADLPAWVEAHRQGTALEAWPAPAYDGLLDVAQRAQGLLDAQDRACLVHGDVNPKNLLVEPDSLEVTGLLDWEFAHAGSPCTDLGNLLRFERDPVLTGAVLATWTEAVGGKPDEALELGRAADLWALVDLASRRDDNPVATRAHDLLEAIARSGDLDAWPG
ncbi:MAG: phosphotransferase family protein [Myxococcaceae bacterium]